ncbi:hypothetical protein KP509_17G013600 [Ceratopteris richardii]|uniref:BZIP domain-containing protein n=1 Tax=Ceratopteris richardii TaxID=49495 RepID=A0A8T2SS75_CERRI|nr:hypothetical protein KP509_17G013600 [Ceratopteris richardii]KAH7372628.1 hypothetical protein KP509_17G013600 [Ceratopteris richardii]
MAQLVDGDGERIHRGLIGNAPALPPRFPSLPNRVSDLGTMFQGYYGMSGSTAKNYKQHRSLPAYHMPIQAMHFPHMQSTNGSDILSINKAMHRRSASDSFVCLEEKGDIFTLNDIPEESDVKELALESSEKAENEVHEDGDQLSDLLEEIQQLHNRQNIPVRDGFEAFHHKSECSPLYEVGCTNFSAEAGSGHRLHQQVVTLVPKSVSSNLENNNENSIALPESHEGDFNSKRTKRQSAQRSRVRKLQYIAELERVVGTLQMEVSSLSLQLMYLKHERARLNMDNSALKQQVVFFVQEKRNKDIQNEILKDDLRRLQKSHQKSSRMQQMQQTKQQQIQRHCSLPTDFISGSYQCVEFDKVSQQIRPVAGSADEHIGLMRDFVGLSLESAINGERTCLDVNFNEEEKFSTTDGIRIVRDSSR